MLFPLLEFATEHVRALFATETALICSIHTLGQPSSHFLCIYTHMAPQHMLVCLCVF